MRYPGEPVLLHFHGGGYLCGTAAESDLTSSIPKSLVEYSPLHHILSVDYRLAPKAPWPLPLLDAISAYYWLVTSERIPECDIIVGGDSAGGHLALALMRWLGEESHRFHLKGPRGLILMSPWTDVGFTNAWGKENYVYNSDSDTVSGKYVTCQLIAKHPSDQQLDSTFGPFATSLLLRALPVSTMHTSPYLSPASLLLPPEAVSAGLFRTFPPTYVVFGSAERLASSIDIFWSRLGLSRKIDELNGHPPRAISDAIIAGKDAPHDFMIFPWMDDEAAKIYEDLDTWLRQLLSTETEEDEDAVEAVLSPEEAASPDWRDIMAQRRESRRMSLMSFKTGKSPVMRPSIATRSPMAMVGEMRSEGLRWVSLSAHTAKCIRWVQSV
jgi:acetyl esterase/lipase